MKHTFYIVVVISLILSSGCKKSSKTTEIAKKPENVVAEAGMDINLFFQAALNGDLNVLDKFISDGVIVNILDEQKRTAVMLASYNGHESLVSYIIKKGADVNLVDESNRTALMFAATGPFSSTVKALLDAGADPNVIDNTEKFSALMFAAAEGQLEVVKMLIDRGANPKFIDIDGDSAYDFAVSRGHKDVAELLKGIK